MKRLAVAIPSSPAMPSTHSAEAVASKAPVGSTAMKATMSAVPEHPVAVICASQAAHCEHKLLSARLS